MPQADTRLDQLQTATDTAARHVRAVYLVYLLFGLYLAVIIGATTPEQLLLEQPVRLPLLDVALPLVAFYWLAPLLFLILHLHLLVQLVVLADKVHRLDLAIERDVRFPALRDLRRSLVHPLPFAQLLLGRQHGVWVRAFLWLIVWLTVVAAPLLLLLGAEARLLAYHGTWTTMVQRAVVLLDLAFLFLLWPRLRFPGDRVRARPERWLWHRVKGLPRTLVVGVFALVALAFPAGVGEPERGDPIEAGVLRLLGVTGPIEEVADPLDQPGLGAALYVRAMRALYGLPFLARNLEVGGADLSARQVSLRGRDLRYGGFHGSDLGAADLAGANLRGAVLAAARLPGADLGGAIFEGADLRGADLAAADLGAARLAGADLTRARLAGAALIGASLDAARLPAADLRGANLERAVLSAARLAGADLLAAALQGADLRGADLRRVDLRAADLRGAALEGALIAGARLEGADLRGAHLWQTDLGTGEGRDGRWLLADLREVDAAPLAEDELDRLAKRAGASADPAVRGALEALLERLRAADGSAFVPDFPPEWRRNPNVLLAPDDPFDLGWRRYAMEAEVYDRLLAQHLATMLCGAAGNGAALRRLVERYLGEASERTRLVTRLLARELATPDRCPLAAALPEDLLSELSRLGG